MKIVMLPMDDGLAAMGVCCGCHQEFEGESFYCQIASDDQDVVTVWLACIGCSAIMACTN